MKKYLSISLAVILIFLCSSCGLTVTEIKNTQASTTTTVKKEIHSKTTVTKTTEEKTTSTSTETKTEAFKTTTTKSTEKITAKKFECTVEISCKKILENEHKLKENKAKFLPKSGTILRTVSVTVDKGGTAFDAIKKACENNVCTDGCKYCRKNGIQLDFIYTPGYDSYYIRGVHQIYEKDCGTQSGWMYCVNGEFPNYGCNQYKVKNGDKIQLLFTCDLGDDLGAE